MSHRSARCLHSVIITVARRPSIASRETSSQTLKLATASALFKTRQPFGASVLASPTVYSAHHGHGGDSFGRHPVSVVGSQVSRAYPLRQETGIVAGRMGPVRSLFCSRIRFLLTTLQPGVNVQLTNILVPPLSSRIPNLRTSYEDRDRCRPRHHPRPVSRKSCRTRSCHHYDRNH
jgi:hypothetical protein